MSGITFVREESLTSFTPNEMYAMCPSLGNPSRDYHLVVAAFGEEYHIVRQAVSLKNWPEYFKRYDGQVGAFGGGGCDLGVRTGPEEKLLHFHSIVRACANIAKTPFDDGHKLKRIIEPWAINEAIKLLEDHQRNCLIPVGSERWHLVLAAQKADFNVLLGDLPFSLGIGGLVPPFVIEKLVPVMMPIVGRLPFHWLYPTGKKQLVHNPTKFKNHFDWADLIAGDYLYIDRYMPSCLEDKVIVTNTTTIENRERMFRAGLKAVITTTPTINGRSPGTNAYEALLATILRRNNRPISDKSLRGIIRQLEIGPVVHLNT
ncbi:MAG: hypothetical protein WCO23_03255 [bacterium]